MKKVLKIVGGVVLVVVVTLGGLGAYVMSLPWRNRCGDAPPVARVGREAVATSQPLATRAAAQVLADGGSAADAAIAAALMLAVAEPGNSGLGGGGFALIHDASKHETVSLDFRETAPIGLDAKALEAVVQQSPNALRNGALAVAVPSEWAGLTALHARYGRLPLSRLAQPAIAAAREGVALGMEQAARCWVRTQALRADPEARRIFMTGLGLCPFAGWTLHQPELAETLRRLTDQSHPEPWNDVVGKKMIAYLAANGSSMREADLDRVHPLWRPVVSGTFAGKTIVSMAPPSSGGLIVIGLLQTYERLRQRLPNANRFHVWIEAARLAFFDRAMLLGDPDFTEVPTAKLASSEYAFAQAARVDAATPLVLESAEQKRESQHTTHLSVVDKDGFAVAMTITINVPYGSGLVVPGTGVLLNDQMDDFYVSRPNAFGLIGNEKNAPLPGKRPLSSMAPTMVFDGDTLIAVLGSPGGSGIPSSVAWVIRGLLEDGQSGADALHAPRIHHQWFPDKLEVEPGFDRHTLPDDLQKIASRPPFPIGRVQMLLHDKDGWRGFSDCRDGGEAVAR